MNNVQWISAELIGRAQETPSLVYLRLSPKLEDIRIDFQAGQCVKISSPAGHESTFAIASEPEEKRFIEFLIKDHEAGAAHELCRIKIGNQIKIGQPFGRGYPMERFKGKDILLVGMGSGLSPLRSLLKSLLRREHQFGKIIFLYGARTPEDIPFKNEFDLWSKKIDLRLAISKPLSPHSGFLGRVTHLLPKLNLPDVKNMVVCVCGHRTMQEEVTNLLERAGISKENVLTNH